jgi:hypothetical protein
MAQLRSSDAALGGTNSLTVIPRAAVPAILGQFHLFEVRQFGLVETNL